MKDDSGDDFSAEGDQSATLATLDPLLIRQAAGQ